jgi:hypothetical protein
MRAFRDPDPSGYRTSFAVSGGEKVGARLPPQVEISVSALFPA